MIVRDKKLWNPQIDGKRREADWLRMTGVSPSDPDKNLTLEAPLKIDDTLHFYL